MLSAGGRRMGVKPIARKSTEAAAKLHRVKKSTWIITSTTEAYAGRARRIAAVPPATPFARVGCFGRLRARQPDLQRRPQRSTKSRPGPFPRHRRRRVRHAKNRETRRLSHCTPVLFQQDRRVLPQGRFACSKAVCCGKTRLYKTNPWLNCCQRTCHGRQTLPSS